MINYKLNEKGEEITDLKDSDKSEEVQAIIDSRVFKGKYAFSFHNYV
ncbi:MAG: hypothetical protein Q4F97_12505 [Bacteroidales bacterium]|nr:hypothetical protein [Bacteroidales bacterium]